LVPGAPQDTPTPRQIDDSVKIARHELIHLYDQIAAHHRRGGR
jgi:hypothetical protein